MDGIEEKSLAQNIFSILTYIFAVQQLFVTFPFCFYFDWFVSPIPDVSLMYVQFLNMMSDTSSLYYCCLMLGASMQANMFIII